VLSNDDPPWTFWADLLQPNCDRWGVRNRRGNQNGSAPGDTLPLNPDCEFDQIGAAADVANPFNSKDFNPNFGGLNRNAKLITTGRIYQTLPLFENLHTTGIYVFPEAIDLAKKTADVNVEAEVVNETGDYASITLSAVVVDADGVVRAKLEGNTSDLVAGQSEVLTASGTLKGARFWDVTDPYLYRVYSILSVGGKVVDVCETTTGFRQTEFKGGVGTGGVWINGRFVWLTGYAQRSANDWAGLGGAYPLSVLDFVAIAPRYGTTVLIVSTLSFWAAGLLSAVAKRACILARFCRIHVLDVASVSS
jgi:hypothetical protein